MSGEGRLCVRQARENVAEVVGRRAIRSYGSTREVLALAFFYNQKGHASQKVGAHQAKTFLTVVVEDDCKSFQKYYPWSRPQLCKEPIKNVDMGFWVDFLIYGLIERNNIVSYCQCGQH